MFENLSGMDKVILFSLPLATVGGGVTADDIKVFPGAMVTVDNNGKVILATTNNTPWYICISDSEEPMVKAAGTVALIAGDSRCLTDNFVNGTSLSVGTELAIAPGGKLKVATTTPPEGGVKDIVVGYVEHVVPTSPLKAIVRML